MRTLGRSLPAADFFTLQRFLEKPPANDVLPAAQLDSLKNDVAVKLLACEHLPDDFSRRFIAMASNDALGPVWQNYTLQLLDSLWLRDERPETRHEIIKTLTAATCDTRPTISGVALLTLSRLVEKECASTGNASPIGASPQPVPSRSELGALALAVLQRKEAPSQDKVTALAVASECGDTCAPAVLSLARKWASNKTLPGMQRITAFSVLGRHGDTRDLPILETERNSTDFRLKKASRAAIIKIQTLNRKP
ncbi:MAG: hypothetical protein LBR07_01350 [Puniceicoccales bacterium]|nr:hypothetical protein [Puniceicoccales bacterium]